MASLVSDFEKQFLLLLCLYLLQAHPSHKKWHSKSFPLYDDILPLVDGRHATGEFAFWIPEMHSLSPPIPEEDANDRSPTPHGPKEDEETGDSSFSSTVSCFSYILAGPVRT